MRGEKRFSQGFSFLAHYTFSKVLSDAVGDQQVRFEPFLDNNNPKNERARAPYDITHAFGANGSYELPFGEGHRLNVADKGLGRLISGFYQIGQRARFLPGFEEMAGYVVHALRLHALQTFGHTAVQLSTPAQEY